jgi:hypothetical protein
VTNKDEWPGWGRHPDFIVFTHNIALQRADIAIPQFKVHE